MLKSQQVDYPLTCKMWDKLNMATPPQFRSRPWSYCYPGEVAPGRVLDPPYRGTVYDCENYILNTKAAIHTLTRTMSWYTTAVPAAPNMFAASRATLHVTYMHTRYLLSSVLFALRNLPIDPTFDDLESELVD